MRYIHHISVEQPAAEFFRKIAEEFEMVPGVEGIAPGHGGHNILIHADRDLSKLLIERKLTFWTFDILNDSVTNR